MQTAGPGPSQPQLLLTHLALVLALATLLGWLCRRYLRVPVVGELLAGVLLGPSLLGNLPPDAMTWLSPRRADPLFSGVTQLAVVLLAGVSGAHLNLSGLRRDGRPVAKIAASALLIPLAAGMAAAAMLPGSVAGSPGRRAQLVLFIGVAMCVSAIPVIAITLHQLGLLDQRLGQLILAAACLDDIAGWLILSVLTALVIDGGPHAVLLALAGVAALLLSVALARAPMQAVLTAAARRGEQSCFGLILAVVLAGSAISSLVGLEPVVGAMLAGVLVGRCTGPPAAVNGALDILVSGFCAPVFLAGAGMQVDLRSLARPPVLVSGCALLLVASGSKLAGGYLGARWGRLDRRLSLAVGAGLNSRGVVEIVIASVGLRIGVLNTALYTVIVIIAAITSFGAPIALRAIVGDTALACSTLPSAGPSSGAASALPTYPRKG